MTTNIEAKINNLILSLEAHDIHLGSVDTRFAIEAEIIDLQREHIELLSKSITLLEKRLGVMEKTALEHGERITMLAKFITRLASQGLLTQQELKELRNEK